jgi:hypothetical protein
LDQEFSLLSDSDWRAVFEWCRETGVEFYLKEKSEENPSLEMSLAAVEPARVVTQDGTVAFVEIEWIKVPFEAPFLRKAQPDFRPFLQERGIRFEERPNGVVIRGRTRTPEPSA